MRNALCNARVFQNREIPVFNSRPAQDVSARIADSPRDRHCECRKVEVPVNSGSVKFPRPNAIWPPGILKPDTSRVRRSECRCERKTRLVVDDSVKTPAPAEFVYQRRQAVSKALFFPKRKLVIEAGHQPLRRIKRTHRSI